MAITLQVLAAEAVFFGKRASRKVVAAIVIVCMGVGLSTVTDTQVRTYSRLLMQEDSLQQLMSLKESLNVCPATGS